MYLYVLEHCFAVPLYWQRADRRAKDCRLDKQAWMAGTSRGVQPRSATRFRFLSGLDCHRRRMPGFRWLCGPLLCRCVHGIWPRAEHLLALFASALFSLLVARPTEAVLGHGRDMSPTLNHALALLPFLGASLLAF